MRFTFEESEGFAPLPTMPVVMAGPGFWVREPDSGVTWEQVLHGEQRLTLHNPMPAEGVAVGRTRIDGIVVQTGCYTVSQMQVEDGWWPDNPIIPCAGESANGNRLQMLPVSSGIEGALGDPG